MAEKSTIPTLEEMRNALDHLAPNGVMIAISNDIAVKKLTLQGAKYIELSNKQSAFIKQLCSHLISHDFLKKNEHLHDPQYFRNLSNDLKTRKVIVEYMACLDNDENTEQFDQLKTDLNTMIEAVDTAASAKKMSLRAMNLTFLSLYTAAVGGALTLGFASLLTIAPVAFALSVVVLGVGAVAAAGFFVRKMNKDTAHKDTLSRIKSETLKDAGASAKNVLAFSTLFAKEGAQKAKTINNKTELSQYGDCIPTPIGALPYVGYARRQTF